MEKLPEKWTLRIWERLENIFGDKWRERYSDEKRRGIYLTQWCTGLMGMTSADIQHALMMLESSELRDFPPTVIDFYLIGKRLMQIAKPKNNYPTWIRGSGEVAKAHMDEIRAKVRY